MTSQEEIEKWRNYYVQNFLPWDSNSPSSQLIQYLTSCVASPETNDLVAPSMSGVTNNGNHVSSAQLDYHCCSRCQHIKPVAKSMGHGFGLTALELCCGTGSSCILMASLPSFRKVVGVDLVSEAVDTAKARAKEVGSNIEQKVLFWQKDVFELPVLKGIGPWEGDLDGLVLDDGALSGDGATTSIMKTKFDFIYDCQAFHALRRISPQKEQEYLSLLYNSLNPGGTLLMLTGNARQPTTGPPVVSEQELRTAFGDTSKWEWIWLKETYFDETEHYRTQLKERPLAWWVVLRRL